MLKKSLFAVALALASTTSIASTSTEMSSGHTENKLDLIQTGKHLYDVKESDYTTLSAPLENVSPVIEFFSYRCVYCYMYDRYMNLEETVNKTVFNGKPTFTFNNIDYSIQDSSDITLAYIVAKERGADFLRKFSDEMYKGFHETNTIQSGEDIFAIFKKLGLTDEEIHQAFNDPKNQVTYDAEVTIAKQLNPKYTPTILVKGKYVLDVASIAKGLKEPKTDEERDLVLLELQNRIVTVIQHLNNQK